MGCYQSQPNDNMESIQKRMLQPRKFVMIQIKNKEIQIDQEEFCIGDFYTKDISEQDMIFHEKNFKKKFFFAFAKYHQQIDYTSRQSLIESLLQLPDAQKKIQKIILQVGLPQTFRWILWQTFIKISKEENFVKKRKKIFQDLIMVENKENEIIVSKDIPRTAPGKKMFKQKNSIGSLYLQKVLKALGGFFPSINYVQGMNFLGATMLEVSGLNDFESWNLIIEFWLKETNLYYGIYDVNFPMMKFFQYSFHYILQRIDYNLYQTIQKKQFRDEFWLIQWILSFYTNILPKNLLVLCLDFLIMTDCFGMVFVALSICYCLKECFQILEIEDLLLILKDKQKLQQKIDKKQFVDVLYSYLNLNLNKYQILTEYNQQLQKQQKKTFLQYFNILKYSLQGKKVPQKYKFLKFYDNLPSPAEIEFLKKSNYLQQLHQSQKKMKLIDISNIEKLKDQYIKNSTKFKKFNQVLTFIQNYNMYQLSEKNDLVEIQRDYIKSICKSIDGLKCMIFDKFSSELISLNFLQSEAFELEVFLFEDIKNIEDEKMHYVSAIYLIAQPQQSIQYIQQELQNPNFKEYHFFFLSDVPDDLIRRFAEFDQYDLVKNLQRLYCNYHAINPHLYHSNVRQIYNIFDKSLDQWGTQERQNLFQIEESIVSAFMSLRKKPVIQYVKNSDLCSQLAHNLDQKFQKLNLQFRSELKQTHPLLIIIDRKEDPFTPLLQEWSYQNLLHELIGINNNKISAKGKEYNLSLQYDEFYKKNLYSNYSEVANNLKQMIEKLQQQKQQYKNLKKFKDMQNALSSMQDYQKDSSITEKHLALTDSLTKIIESKNLINISQFQQQLVSKNQKKNHQREIEKFINDSQTQPKEKLILVCLFILIYQDTQSSSILEQNLIQQHREFESILKSLKKKCCLKNRTINFLDVNKEKDFFSVYKDLFSQQQNAFEIHIPLVCILIQEILKGKNLNQTFSIINSNEFGNFNKNVTEIMIYILGGVTYSEVKKINDLNKMNQGKQFWIGGSSMLNSDQFFEEYLGQKI